MSVHSAGAIPSGPRPGQHLSWLLRSSADREHVHRRSKSARGFPPQVRPSRRVEKMGGHTAVACRPKIPSSTRVTTVAHLVPQVVGSGAIGTGIDGLLPARQQGAWASSETRLGRCRRAWSRITAHHRALGRSQRCCAGPPIQIWPTRTMAPSTTAPVAPMPTDAKREG